MRIPSMGLFPVVLFILSCASDPVCHFPDDLQPKYEPLHKSGILAITDVTRVIGPDLVCLLLGLENLGSAALDPFYIKVMTLDGEVGSAHAESCSIALQVVIIAGDSCREDVDIGRDPARVYMLPLMIAPELVSIEERSGEAVVTLEYGSMLEPRKWVQVIVDDLGATAH